MNSLIQQISHKYVIADRKNIFRVGQIISIKTPSSTINEALVIGISRSGNSSILIVAFKGSTGAIKAMFSINNPDIKFTILHSHTRQNRKRILRQAKSYFLLSKNNYAIFKKKTQY